MRDHPCEPHGQKRGPISPLYPPIEGRITCLPPGNTESAFFHPGKLLAIVDGNHAIDIIHNPGNQMGKVHPIDQYFFQEMLRLQLHSLP